MGEHQAETYLGISPIQSPAELPSDNPLDNDILVENTRRNSLQAQDVVPEGIKQTILNRSSESSSCQRCSGDGTVAKPCRFCNATGKVRTRSSCIDCEAEKNGCGNTNCKSCSGVGRVMLSNDCETCDGSGKGLSLTCGDCGGCGHGSPPSSVRSSVDSKCGSIKEEE